MLERHEVCDEVVLRLHGTIEGTTIAAGHVRTYKVRLDTGDLLSLTPEQFAAAVDGERARHLLLSHLFTGEPLGSDEVAAIATAGLATRQDFDMTGGDLWRHVLLQEDEEE